MDKLTDRQQQVLDLIRQHIEDTGYPPTRADIARELGDPTTADGYPDFARMDVAERLAYHRERLGLGR